MARLARFRAAVDAAAIAAVEADHLARFEAEYRPKLAAAYRQAAKRLALYSITAAGEPAKWSIPDADELVPQTLAAVLEQRRNQRSRLRVIEAVAGDALAALDLSFDVTNPLAQGVAARAGTRMTSVVGTVQRDVMTIIQNAHEQGLSIPDAAEAIRSQAQSLSEHQARRIARTELIGLVNGASVASARLSGVADYKEWMTAGDAKVRDDHAEADGQVVSVGEPFIVGGDELQYPGDQSTADASEVVNCRCTVGYPDGPEGLTAGGGMAKSRLRIAPRTAAAPPVEAPPVAWRSLSVPEGVWTSDGRMIALGATDWRELPLPLMAQFATDVGHDGARISGRVDAYERNDQSEVWGSGVFDSGVDGAETARLVGDGTLRGVSVDLADMDVTVDLVDENGDPVPVDEEGYPVDESAVADMRMTATRAVIMGQTVTPFPAFAEGRIELLLPDGEPITASVLVGGRPRAGEFTVDRARFSWPLTAELHQAPLTAAAPVTTFTGSMISVHPLPDEASAIAVEGGQPPEQLHVTIAHIDGENAPDHDALVAAVETVAAGFGPIRGEVAGAGHFSAGEDGTPILALIDAPGLDDLRVAVTAALRAAGVQYSENHGFLPHVTLSYADEAALPEAQGLVGRPVSFLSLSVETGTGRSDLALDSGGSGSAQGSAAGARTDLPLDAAASTSAAPMPERPMPRQGQNAATSAYFNTVDEVVDEHGNHYRVIGISTDTLDDIPPSPPSFTVDDVERAKAAVDAGLITANEARMALGFPPNDAASDLIVPAGTDPTHAVLASALSLVASRQPAVPAVNVPAFDATLLAKAIEALQASGERHSNQMAAALQAIADRQQPQQPPTVLVVERGSGGAKRMKVTRDANGLMTDATVIEEDG